MTPYFFLKAYCSFLRNTVTEYAAAQGDKGIYKVPQVFEWFVPFQNSRTPEKSFYPFVSPRIVKGGAVSEQRGGYATPFGDDSLLYVLTFFGVYSEGKENDSVTLVDGAYDLLNLMEHVRIALVRKPILENKYQLKQPYTWEITDEQPHPLWIGQATSIWTIPTIYEETGVKKIYDI